MKTVGGTELPLAGLKDDVAEVMAVLERLNKEGKKPLLLCHSSGGLVGSNAVSGYDVTGLIYLAAFLIPKGNSLLAMLGGNPLPWMIVQVGFPFLILVPSQLCFVNGSPLGYC
jgi:alpha-beta hydrolase superfamily lysophospholipase